ncbi:MAG: hypothetical protein CM1200mP22_31750 [Dehalococcoidia bacterium]|nr:MAG: hypothetical protein CM1200mP22_31750 [Dehalococcoidia bacterium]
MLLNAEAAEGWRKENNDRVFQVEQEPSAPKAVKDSTGPRPSQTTTNKGLRRHPQGDGFAAGYHTIVGRSAA